MFWLGVYYRSSFKWFNVTIAILKYGMTCSRDWKCEGFFCWNSCWWIVFPRAGRINSAGAPELHHTTIVFIHESMSYKRCIHNTEAYSYLLWTSFQVSLNLWQHKNPMCCFCREKEYISHLRFYLLVFQVIAPRNHQHSHIYA